MEITHGHDPNDKNNIFRNAGEKIQSENVNLNHDLLCLGMTKI